MRDLQYKPVLTVKRGDRYQTRWTVPLNLVGASVRLIARRKNMAPIYLDAEIFDAENGVVSHLLDGTLKVGTYQVELEITKGLDVMTAPSAAYENLRVIADLG